MAGSAQHHRPGQLEGLSKVLFEHVLAQQQEDEETIIVSLGCDPLKVKKERVERGEEEEEEPEAPIIMSIHNAILLDSDCEDESVPAEQLTKRPGKSTYEKVRC